VKADLRELSRVCVKAEPFSALTVGLEIDRIAAGCARERAKTRGAPHFFFHATHQRAEVGRVVLVFFFFKSNTPALTNSFLVSTRDRRKSD